MKMELTNLAPCALIIEDEVLVRLYGADLLAELGFKVVEAGNAAEALHQLEIHQDIGLVFSDVQMPGAHDGLELARLIHCRWPQIALLITSGRPVSRDSLPGAAEFLPKPYDGKALARHVSQLLALNKSTPCASRANPVPVSAEAFV